MEMHDASGALPFDIRKVQQRYTFTSRQREVLLKHFNNGMTCQSQAYHEKIMTCAREAEVDFDIVRNWIGNVRRKMRIEANKMQSPSGGMMMGDNCEPKLPRLEDLQNLFGNQPAKPMQGAMLRTSVGFSPPLSHPPQLSIPSMNLQTQLGNHQQLILTEDSAVSMANAAAANPVFNAKPSPHPMQITKVVSNTNNERDRPSSSSTSSMVSSAAVHSAGPQSTAQTIFFSNEKEIRENDIRRTMGNIQQSVQYLEKLGCDCIVASHYDGKTFVSGTEKGVNYFAEMQEVKPMSEHMRRGGGFNMNASPSGTNNSTMQEDAAEHEHSNLGKRSGERNSDRGIENGDGSHSNKKRKSNLEDEEDDDIEEQDNSLINKKDENPLFSGQEVYIVDKNHFVVGIGSILPTPHHRISLKNAIAPEDFFD